MQKLGLMRSQDDDEMPERKFTRTRKHTMIVGTTEERLLCRRSNRSDIWMWMGCQLRWCSVCGGRNRCKKVRRLGWAAVDVRDDARACPSKTFRKQPWKFPRGNKCGRSPFLFFSLGLSLLSYLCIQKRQRVREMLGQRMERAVPKRYCSTRTLATRPS